MAYLRGPFGTGYVKRLGGTIGQKAGNGQYKIYAYQPDVYNPRTDAQILQRAKFTFCTQLAALFTDDALVGLERQPYANLRTAFLSLNIKQVAVNELITPNEVDVYASCPLMVLSKGYEPAPYVASMNIHRGELTADLRVAVPNSSLPPDEMIITILVPKAIGQSGYNAQVMRVACTYMQEGQGYKEYRARLTDFEVHAGDVDLTTDSPLVSLYAYTVRYESKNRTLGDSSMAGGTGLQGGLVSFNQSYRLMYARHFYSNTMYIEKNNDPS